MLQLKLKPNIKTRLKVKLRLNHNNLISMGFAMGGSVLPLISSSSSSQPHFLLHSHQTKPHKSTKRTRLYACITCMQHHDPKDEAFSHRRMFLFMGVSVLPFLNLKARAFENLGSGEYGNSARAHELNQVAEVQARVDASPNPVLTLLNGLGIVAAGVLGALYALTQKEKSTDVAAIESMKNKLVEKEAAIVSLQKSFESKLQKEKEVINERIKDSNQVKQSLTSQISSANNTINGLEQELQKEKKIIRDLESQIDRLKVNLKQASDDNKDLEIQLKDKVSSIEVLEGRINLLNSEIKDKDDNIANARSALAVRESELKKLNSSYEETRAELTGSKSEIEGLRQEILKLENELGLKSSNLDDLKAEIRSLREEKDVIFKDLESLKNEYKELKFYSGKQTDFDAKRLEESGKKIEELKEKLELTLTQVVKNEELVDELTSERDSLRKSLDIEVGNVKTLENELQIVHKTLRETRNEAAELAGFLEHSKNARKKLEEEFSRVRTEYFESKTTLQKNIQELKETVEALTYNLGSTKDDYEKTKGELNRVSVEIQEISEKRDNLSQELVETYKKLENATHELKEEKTSVGSLTKEVNSLKSEILEDKKSIKSTESDLEEARKAFHEVNQKSKILSHDLEVSKNKISVLEDEKEALYKSLDEQKQAFEVVQQNTEEARNIIAKFGKEKEKLEKIVYKLEKDLAVAKGEILRLRSVMRDSETANKVNKNESEENAEKVQENESDDERETDTAKKVKGRKRVVSQ